MTLPAEPEKYAPDFPGEKWTPAEAMLLEPFATNPNGLVSVISHNLPPEIVGALCSRASRASGSLLRVLLQEYLLPILEGEDKELARELRETIEILRTRGFKNILNNQRAQAFYAKWLSQYGDDSIAQMTGTHVLFWGVSQVAMKYMEDQRVGLEPIEKSTRYVNFGNKINGRYLYYIPRPDLERWGRLTEYTATLDGLFDTYVALLPQLLAWLKKEYADRESVLEKKALDTLRGLLPMATLGQVAFRGNAQALEYLINRTTRHPLGELRWIAHALKQELDKEIPSLLLRLGDERSRAYQEYLAGRKTAVKKFMQQEGMFERTEVASLPTVRLVEYDSRAEDKIITGLIFAAGHMGWAAARATAQNMSATKREELLRQHLNGRTARWHKIGRVFENSYVRFEIVMNIGAYRDLHRHRMMTQDRQSFSTLHGYDLPPEVVAAGLAEQYQTALLRADVLYRTLAKTDETLAQYAVPLAYRMRFYQWQNFRQLFWETELRTISQGHPDYRRIEQEKYRLIKEKFPRLAAAMLVDMNEYTIARRGTEERIQQKEREILKKLQR